MDSARRKLISIIIPTKNEEENILRCLRSIKRQNYSGKIEIVVVDNHSQDETVNLARKFTDSVIISGPERSSQRNVGAASAKADMLLFLDADMEISPSTLKECIRITYKEPRSIVAVNEEAIGKTFWARALSLEKRCYKKAPGWVHAARFFPKREFLKLGGYDKSLVAGEDWDLTQRFIKKGYKLLLTKKSTVTHHEPNLGLYDLLKKEIYYMESIESYAKKNPTVFSRQQNPLYRLSIYTHSANILLPHPFLTGGFLSYKFIVWILWHARKMLKAFYL